MQSKKIKKEEKKMLAEEKKKQQAQKKADRALAKKEQREKKQEQKKAKIAAKKLKKSERKYKRRSRRRKIRPLSYLELSYFCGQMALILKSGISSIEGIEMMEDDFTSKSDQKIVDIILETVSATGQLSVGLAATEAFPDYMIHMVAIGEETGNLDEVMEALEDHYSREEQLRQSIQSAVTYPLIMSCMIIAVIIILLVRVMPIFNQVFRQLGTEMTGFAAGLMAVSNFISTYALLFVILLAIIIAIIIFCVKTDAGKAFSLRITRHFRSSRELNEKIASCRFADGMSLILRSGLSPDRGFDLVTELNDDPYFDKKLNNCRNKMAEGLSLSDALRDSDIFSGVYSRLTSIGTKTGSLDQVMRQIATLYQDEVDTKISNRLAILEPALIVVLSVVVGVILLSVMFPLLGIMATL